MWEKYKKSLSLFLVCSSFLTSSMIVSCTSNDNLNKISAKTIVENINKTKNIALKSDAAKIDKSTIKTYDSLKAYLPSSFTSLITNGYKINFKKNTLDFKTDGQLKVAFTISKDSDTCDSNIITFIGFKKNEINFEKTTAKNIAEQISKTKNIALKNVSEIEESSITTYDSLKAYLPSSFTSLITNGYKINFKNKSLVNNIDGQLSVQFTISKNNEKADTEEITFTGFKTNQSENKITIENIVNQINQNTSVQLENGANQILNTKITDFNSLRSYLPQSFTNLIPNDVTIIIKKNSLEKTIDGQVSAIFTISKNNEKADTEKITFTGFKTNESENKTDIENVVNQLNQNASVQLENGANQILNTEISNFDSLNSYLPNWFKNIVKDYSVSFASIPDKSIADQIKVQLTISKNNQSKNTNQINFLGFKKEEIIVPPSDYEILAKYSNFKNKTYAIWNNDKGEIRNFKASNVTADHLLIPNKIDFENKQITLKIIKVESISNTEIKISIRAELNNEKIEYYQTMSGFKKDEPIVPIDNQKILDDYLKNVKVEWLNNQKKASDYYLKDVLNNYPDYYFKINDQNTIKNKEIKLVMEYSKNNIDTSQEGKLILKANLKNAKKEIEFKFSGFKSFEIKPFLSRFGNNNITQYWDFSDYNFTKPQSNKTNYYTVWARGVSAFKTQKDIQWYKQDPNSNASYEYPFIKYDSNGNYFDINKPWDVGGVAWMCTSAAILNLILWWVKDNINNINLYMQDDEQKGWSVDKKTKMQDIIKITQGANSRSKTENFLFFDYINNEWSDGTPGGGIAVSDWFFKGTKKTTDQNILKHQLGMFHNLLKNTKKKTIYSYDDFLKSSKYNLELNKGKKEGDAKLAYSNFYSQSLLNGQPATISFNVNSNLAHIITVWGADYDDKGNLVALWISDSDDSRTPANQKRDIGLSKVYLKEKKAKKDGFFIPIITPFIGSFAGGGGNSINNAYTPVNFNQEWNDWKKLHNLK